MISYIPKSFQNIFCEKLIRDNSELASPNLLKTFCKYLLGWISFDDKVDHLTSGDVSNTNIGSEAINFSLIQFSKIYEIF